MNDDVQDVIPFGKLVNLTSKAAPKTPAQNSSTEQPPLETRVEDKGTRTSKPAEQPAAFDAAHTARAQAVEGSTLTKAELSELLFERVGLNKREAKDMVETFFEEIAKALENGESVKLSSFGNFDLRDKPQRPGRNPKTGEEIPITARRVVTFHASQKLKRFVER